MPKVIPVKQKGAVKRTVPKKKTGGSAVDRISGIEFDEEEGISLALYGRSGTGKTTLAGTFPGPLLWLVCSSSKNPGELRSLDTAENRKKIKKVVIEKSEDLREIAEYQAETAQFNTLVVDHITGLQDLVLAEILDLKSIPEQKSWGLASQQQYGQCTLQVKELLRPLLDLSCNRVFIAQERDFSREDNNDFIMPTVGAAVSPALAGWINSSCDYLVNTFIRSATESKQVKIGGTVKTVKQDTGKVEYCLRTAPHPVYQTKFRMPRGRELPEVIVDPSYEQIIGLIRG